MYTAIQSTPPPVLACARSHLRHQENTGTRHMSEVMANCGISGNDSMYESTTISSSGSLYAVPDDLIQSILQHLSATDLCHVASCCRWLRDATNQDSFWLPLCQSRGWEHYGTTTDLAKIASYGPSEQATGANEAGHHSVTFQNDRIVTDDNTAGLTSTCRWKGVYMRAYHLDRNWATNCSHFKSCYFDREAARGAIMKGPGLIDGDLLAIFDHCETIRVFDIRKKTLQCVFPSVQPAYNHISSYISKFRDGVIVVPLKNGVACAFDARAGKLLQKIDGNWRDKNVLLFFDGELVITGVLPRSPRDDSEVYRDIYVWCVKDGRLQRILRVDPEDGAEVHDMDYRDKMVVAKYTDGYGRVWDVRSGECLQKLKCPGLNLKFGDNVIVGSSEKGDSFSIWSQDTGECQKVIHVPLHNYRPNQYCWSFEVVGNMILVDRTYIDGLRINSVQAYNLRGEFVSETIVHDLSREGHGRRRIHWVSKMPIERSRQTWTAFNVTPNGFVQLCDVDPQAEYIWIDDIRMIAIDVLEGRLLFHDFW